MKIRSPKQFIELAAAERCGNTPRTFLNMRDAVSWHSNNKLQQLYIFDLKQGSPERYYNVPWPDSTQFADRSDLGAMHVVPLTQAYQAPRVQGEVVISGPPSIRLSPWLLFDPDGDHPLGTVRRAGKLRSLFGLHATCWLKSMLGPEYYEKLLELDEEYPGAVIEFTKFSFCFGVKNEPLIIWEVRHY